MEQEIKRRLQQFTHKELNMLLTILRRYSDMSEKRPRLDTRHQGYVLILVHLAEVSHLVKGYGWQRGVVGQLERLAALSFKFMVDLC